MADWNTLNSELDAWHRAGRPACFWWRDDDATRPSAALETLLSRSGEQQLPLALAVIPRDTDDALRDRLAGEPHVAVLQHGWSHDNHAPDDARQEEFGAHRPLPVMLDELARGWQRIARFANPLPVMVAPWNRMGHHVLEHLPEAGLGGVSTLGPREAAEPVPGVRCVNVHVDIIDWHGSRGFMGVERVLQQVLDHLQAKRSGTADPDESTGLMTHHLFHDEGCWQFLGEFLPRTREHPAVRWLPAREAFWP